jgi:hypothetical protein
MDRSIVIPFAIERGRSPLANDISPLDSAVIKIAPIGVAMECSVRIVFMGERHG